MTAVSKANKSGKSTPKKTHSRRATRKIMQPSKRGTVSRSTIRKVVREVIAKRTVSNEG